MISTLFILIALVSGWLYATQNQATHYHIQSQNGQGLYIMSALYGLPFVISGVLVHSFLSTYPAYSALVDDLVEMPSGMDENTLSFLIMCFYSVIFAWLAAITRNLLSFSLGVIYRTSIIGRVVQLFGIDTSLSPSEKRLSKIVASYDLEAMLWSRLQSQKLVLVTLDTGKAYVGTVDSNLGVDPRRDYFTIEAIISGHRDESMRLVFTTSYDDLLGDNQSSERPLVIIPKAKLNTLAHFDLDLYYKHFTEENSAPEFNGDLISQET